MLLNKIKINFAIAVKIRNISFSHPLYAFSMLQINILYMVYSSPLSSNGVDLRKGRQKGFIAV